MSSDSDLDFESADEDASFEVNSKNNNADQTDILNTSRKDSSGFVESKISEYTLETPKDKTDTEKDTLPNLDNEPIVETAHDTDNNIKEKLQSNETVNDQSESSKTVLSTKLSEVSVTENNSTDNTSEVEAIEKKCHQEKQRVPLRLEKKIQQKQVSKNIQQESKSESIKDDRDVISPEKTELNQDAKSSWGFGSWSTSFLSTAASSVSTFTNQVSQGIGTVFETVESSLGAPPPEELASILNERKSSADDDSSIVKTEEETVVEREDLPTATSGILPSVSSWTKVLENTGSKVLMGGLDTLELIGKKTIDMITEGDPGLRKKRAAFSDGITLSQILREAKAEADESKDEGTEGVETVHYSQMFDEFQGLVHLEALEMLSKQSKMNIQRLLMRTPRNSDIKKNLEEIKSICENIPQPDDLTDCEDFEDFTTVCKKHVLELSISFNVENIIKVQEKIANVLKNYEDATATISTPEEIYHSAIRSLAEFTAKSMEAFHKLAELILVQPTLEPNVEHFATNLTGLTTVMCIEINNISARYHHCLDSIAEQYENSNLEKSNITVIVTNLYLEAGNSNKYIQDAFLLLVPVLQESLLESSQ